VDTNLREWVVEHRLGVLDPLFEGLSLVGSFGLVWLALALAVVLAGSSWRQPWLLLRVAVAIVLAELVSGLLKAGLGRDRPPVAHPDPEPLVHVPATFSFPSGHATVSFACATVLALAVPRLAWPLFTVAALVAFSRVYVGVHYPGDVLAGAILGVAIGLVVSRAPPRPRAGPRRSLRAPRPG
jgi:undecaprenyl-diphosphatase